MSRAFSLSVSEELTSRPGNTATCQTEKGPREVAERQEKGRGTGEGPMCTEHEYVPIVLHTLFQLTHYFDLGEVGSSIPILQMRTLRLEEVN